MELGESREDYLEAAYVLKLRKGYVRNAMICRYMGYSQASISVGIKILREDGYLIRDSDGFLEITEKGETLAKKIYARHLVLRAFLERLGVSPETADRDACRIEHVISEESYQKIRELVENLKTV